MVVLLKLVISTGVIKTFSVRGQGIRETGAAASNDLHEQAGTYRSFLHSTGIHQPG